MRTEYEFIGESGQRLRVAESSSTGLDVWCEKDEFPAGWETADVDLDAGAFLDAASELLKLARIIDALVGDNGWPDDDWPTADRKKVEP